MTDKKSRRVVIIDNINSDSIDQAIFILKSDTKSPQGCINPSVAKEAQTIIDNYIRQVERLKDGYATAAIPKFRKKKLPLLMLLTLSALGALCVCLSLTIFNIL